MPDRLKPLRGTKSVANASTRVIEKDEMLVVTPDSGSGKGRCQIRFGDGVTQAKNLPIAIDGENADDMKVSTLPTVSDTNPALNAGETIKLFFAKIKKKFTYVENLCTNLQTLANGKISTSMIYSGLDSSNNSQVLAAPAGKQLKQLCDNNATAISGLNSDLASAKSNIDAVFRTNNNSAVNLNSLESGFCYCNTDCQNLPEQTHGFCLTYYRDANTRMQMFLTLTNKMYCRIRSTGIWNQWVEK